ncbi:6,7-dimethyl-8-ribityllumazine synthase [Flavobacteriaceae bacterium D16]|nr:6,7-dimethyl-8-ribityllumazine synthase [Flavobacteriaceae bacterium D16]
MATAGKNLSEYDKSGLPQANIMRIGLVVSEWNNQITENLYKGAYKTLVDCGVAEENIIRWDVPGSFELTYGCKKMIEVLDPDAVIAIGSVIRGETKHFDFVAGATAEGIKDLNIKYNTPTIFCVLTDDTLQQAIDRSGGAHGNKGAEAAVAAIKMASLSQK